MTFLRTEHALAFALMLGSASAVFVPKAYGLVQRVSETDNGRQTATVMFAIEAKPLTQNLLSDCLSYYRKEFPNGTLTCRVFRSERFGNVYDLTHKNVGNCWLQQAISSAEGHVSFEKNPALQTNKCRPADR